MQLTDIEAERIVRISLSDTDNATAEMVWADFCNDCPKREADGQCFPCKTATSMMKVYAAELIRQRAKRN